MNESSTRFQTVDDARAYLLRSGAVLAESRGDRSISLIDEVWKSELGYAIYLHAPQGYPVDVDYSRDVLS